MRYLPDIAFTPSDAAGLPDGTVIFPDLASATIGYARRDGVTVAVYDEDLCIEAFVASGMDYEDAADHYSFNTVGTAVNTGMPILLERVCETCGQRTIDCECDLPLESARAA